MSTIERDELLIKVSGQFNGVDLVPYLDAKAIVDSLKAKLAEVTRERDELKRERATRFCDVERIKEWWHSSPRKNSALAFTCGPERSIAIGMEMLADDLAQAREQLEQVRRVVVESLGLSDAGVGFMPPDVGVDGPMSLAKAAEVAIDTLKLSAEKHKLDAEEVGKALTTVQAEAAAMREALFEQPPGTSWTSIYTYVSSNATSETANERVSHWCKAHLENLQRLENTTAGRDLQEEMRRKDERIKELEGYEAELSAVRDLVQKKHHMGGVMHVGMLCVAQAVKDLIENMPDVEAPSMEDDQPTPEPVWQYRNDGSEPITTCWRTRDGVSVEYRYMGGWEKSDRYPNWQACVDDPATFACDESGERIEEENFGQQIVDGLQAFSDKLASGEEIRGTRVTIKDGEVTSEKDVVVIPAPSADAPLLAIARELREALKGAPIYEQGGAVIAYPDKVGKAFDLLCKLRDAKGGGPCSE